MICWILTKKKELDLYHKSNNSNIFRIHGSIYMPVSIYVEAMHIYNFARRRMVIANSGLNRTSSRSHVLLKTDLAIRVSRSAFGDCASNEPRNNAEIKNKIKENEAKKIKNDILLLQRIILGYKPGGTQVYGDSTFTKVLSSFFGNAGRIKMLTCISSETSYEKTLKRLQEARLANNIQVVNKTARSVVSRNYF